MKRIITAAEVIKWAFASSPEIREQDICATTILLAEEKFIKPVVGGLWPRMVEGGTVALLNEYIKPALAQYVKLLLLSQLAASVGSLGVVQYKSGTFSPANEKQLKLLRSQARSNANSLMRRAVEHIENNMELYPEYEPAQNILNRRSIVSEIVL